MGSVTVSPRKTALSLFHYREEFMFQDLSRGLGLRASLFRSIAGNHVSLNMFEFALRLIDQRLPDEGEVRLLCAADFEPALRAITPTEAPPLIRHGFDAMVSQTMLKLQHGEVICGLTRQRLQAIGQRNSIDDALYARIVRETERPDAYRQRITDVIRATAEEQEEGWDKIGNITLTPDQARQLDERLAPQISRIWP